MRGIDRRDLLKIAPLAALAAVSVKVGNQEAKAFELRQGKRYILVVENDGPYVDDFSRELKRHGIDGIICAGDPGLTVYELDAKQ